MIWIFKQNGPPIKKSFIRMLGGGEGTGEHDRPPACPLATSDAHWYSDWRYWWCWKSLPNHQNIQIRSSNNCELLTLDSCGEPTDHLAWWIFFCFSETFFRPQLWHNWVVWTGRREHRIWIKVNMVAWLDVNKHNIHWQHGDYHDWHVWRH